MLQNDSLPFYNFYVANSDGMGTEVDLKFVSGEVPVNADDFVDHVRDYLLGLPGAATCVVKKYSRNESTVNSQ